MRLRKLFITSLLLACFSLCTQFSFGTTAVAKEAPESVNGVLAELTDEQVRQMLIKELLQNQQQENKQPFGGGVQGPGSPLEKLLSSLDSESEESEDRFNKLWANIPNLIPDLYKVLVAL